jgi:hypothetical protein
MSRAILCQACGVVRPTHPEDAARGMFSRYVRGELRNRSLVCDRCDKSLNPGDPVVCVSQPTTVAAWEHEYLVEAAR